jgi:hypothetical protein
LLAGFAASSSRRLGGDEMTADPDDGDAGDASKTSMAICSTSDEVGDIIG